jgi:hypothetical protein
MFTTVDTPSAIRSSTVSSAPAMSSPLDIRIAAGRDHDVAVTVSGVIGPDGAAIISELVRALAGTGALHVIVDLVGPAGHGQAIVSRLLEPVRAGLRARGGWLMVAGDDETAATATTRLPDLHDAFAAYRGVLRSDGGR